MIAKEFSNNQLRKAIIDGDISPVLQPIISLKDGQILGAEVLARWYVSEGISIPPDAFIPQAEALGLIVPLTTGLMSRVKDALLSFCSLERKSFGLKIGFNASPECLMSGAFERECLHFMNDFRGTGIELTIELTERDPITDKLTPYLRRLRAAGVTIALDDYGTGYATADVLDIVTPCIVKTDRSLTCLAGTGDPQNMLKNNLSYLLGYPEIKVLAEGVETADEANWLYTHGITLAQGYAFGSPMSAEFFLHQVKKSNVVF